MSEKREGAKLVVNRDLVKAAMDAALGIPYEAYEELVAEFIEDEFVDIYGRPEVWSDIALGVVERLEALR
jgi:hypothetical protein